jgi:hypothetical protein
MALGRGLCSDTTGAIRKPSVKLLCQWIKTTATDLSMVRGFKSVLYDGMGRRKFGMLAVNMIL